MNIPVPIGDLVAILILGIGYYATIVWMLLTYKQVPGRLIHVLIALFGSDVIISLVSLAAGTLGRLLFSESDSMDIAQLIWVPSFAWSLIVSGWIFKHAGNMSHTQGFFLALTIYFLYLVIFSALFPSMLNK